MKTALRSLRRYPGTSLLAIVLLAIGIGGSTSTFTLLYGVLLKPLNYPEPENLVGIHLRQGSEGLNSSFGLGSYREAITRLRSLESSAAFTFAAFSWQTDSGRRQIAGLYTVGDLSAVFRSPPALGRWFGPQESGVVVITHGFWVNDLGGDPDVVGRTLRFGTRENTIVGVLRPDFEVPLGRGVPVVAPLPDSFPGQDMVGIGPMNGWLARLYEGVNLAQAEEDLRRISRELAAAFPEHHRDVSFRPEPLLHWIVPAESRRLLVLLSGVALGVLLLCLATVAGLQLLRAVRNVRQLAVRRCLGAGFGRLFVQKIGETAAVVVPAASIGVLGTLVGHRSLMSVLPALPRRHEVAVEVPVLAFAVLLSALAITLCSLAPLLATEGRRNLIAQLKSSGQGASAPSSPSWLQSGLVVFQIMLATALLVGGAMMMRTISNAVSLDLGLNKDGLHVISLATGESREARRSVREQLSRLIDEVERLPGVNDVALNSRIPITRSGVRIGFLFEGQKLPADPTEQSATAEVVSAGYFSRLGIPLVAGREFSRTDSEGAAVIVIVNEAFVHRYLMDRPVLGAHLDVGTIVGVVGDVVNIGLREPPGPTLYLPLSRTDIHVGFPRIFVRSSSPSLVVAEKVQGLASVLNPRFTVRGIESIDEIVVDRLGAAQFVMRLLSVLSGMALLLSVGGIFAVVALRSQLRIAEFGIRQVCGANRGHIHRLVLGQAGRLAISGLAGGLALSFWATGLIESYLFQVDRVDVTSLVAAVAMLALAVIAACWLPARRAARIQPMEALRCE